MRSWVVCNSRQLTRRAVPYYNAMHRALVPLALMDLIHGHGHGLGPAFAARATWAFAHGMVILEIHGRFPDDADLSAAWKRGLKALHP